MRHKHTSHHGPIFDLWCYRRYLRKTMHIIFPVSFTHLKAEGSNRSSIRFYCMFLGSGYFPSLLQRASTAKSDPFAFCCSSLPFSTDMPSRHEHALPTPDGIKHLFNLPSYLKKETHIAGSLLVKLQWLIITDNKKKIFMYDSKSPSIFLMKKLLQKLLQDHFGAVVKGMYYSCRGPEFDS